MKRKLESSGKRREDASGSIDTQAGAPEVPNFIAKTRTMVDDTTNVHNMIRWGAEGTSIIIDNVSAAPQPQESDCST